MSFTSAMTAATLTALASLFTVTGCGGDECVKAADHLEECIPLGSNSDSTTSTTSTTGGTGLETMNTCDGLLLCESKCINEAGCPTLQAMYSHKDDDGLAAYNACMTKCNSTTK